MAVSNRSLYEGGTSVSEAVFMAMRSTGRHDKIVILGSVHPEYVQIVRTYLQRLPCEVVIIPTPEGTADVDRVRKTLDDKTACLVVQHPNFFGSLEQVAEMVDSAR